MKNQEGRFTPVEDIGAPQDDGFIGGFDPNRSAVAEAAHYEQTAGYNYPATHPWPSGPTAADGPPAMPSLPSAMPPKTPPVLPQRPIGPHLQVVCGPLLRYDTVSQTKLWHGAILLVTADEGSTYDPHPLLTLEWDPDQVTGNLQGTLNSPSAIGPRTQKIVIPGHELYHHRGQSGTYTFWRFLIEIPLEAHEMSVRYSINRTAKIEFFVPGANQNMRGLRAVMTQCGVTCLISTLMLLFIAWLAAVTRSTVTAPFKNMLDDHDLIDGFGSYPDDLQTSPVFATIGSRGYFWFLLFQLFVVDEVDGTLSQPGQHTFMSTIIGSDGAYIPHPSHSMLSYLGPQVYLLLLDARAERKKEQVCSTLTYNRIFGEIAKLPQTVEHLVLLLGIPIAYPRMNFLEKTLDSKVNPLVMLGKTGTMAIQGFLNKFNADAELLDDLNDHWTAAGHKQERNWLVKECQNLAVRQRLRISFVSGDVHCAAVGAFKSLHTGSRFMPALTPERDYRYMLNIVTSAIVNTPPPAGVLKMVNQLSSKVHKTMHGQDTDETMIALFEKAPDGTPSKSKYIYGARNWAKVVWDEKTGELEFDLRLEKEKGHGVTTGYAVKAPRPLWS
ncbi:hypothetical protein FRB90_003509 [Tulasnella sp. 427]|nr:hypothetical protein FRB90_003509 [Tulasnella sp. 427]